MTLLLSAATASKTPPVVTANRTLTPAAQLTLVGFNSNTGTPFGTLVSATLGSNTLTNCYTGSATPDTLFVGDNLAPVLAQGLTIYVLIPSLSATLQQANVDAFGIAQVSIPGIYAHLNGRIGVATPIGIEAN